jgi:hypothetical protein
MIILDNFGLFRIYKKITLRPILLFRVCLIFQGWVVINYKSSNYLIFNSNSYESLNQKYYKPF